MCIFGDFYMVLFFISILLLVIVCGKNYKTIAPFIIGGISCFKYDSEKKECTEFTDEQDCQSDAYLTKNSCVVSNAPASVTIDVSKFFGLVMDKKTFVLPIKQSSMDGLVKSDDYNRLMESSIQKQINILNDDEIVKKVSHFAGFQTKFVTNIQYILKSLIPSTVVSKDMHVIIKNRIDKDLIEKHGGLERFISSFKRWTDDDATNDIFDIINDNPSEVKRGFIKLHTIRERATRLQKVKNNSLSVFSRRYDEVLPKFTNIDDGIKYVSYMDDLKEYEQKQLPFNKDNKSWTEEELETFMDKYEGVEKYSDISKVYARSVSITPVPLEKNKTYLIPLSIADMTGKRTTGHYNIIIIDNEKKRIFLFDPHVRTIEDEKQIESTLLRMYPSYEFSSSSKYLDICPEMSIQQWDHFCQLWIVIFGFVHLLNDDLREFYEYFKNNRKKKLGLIYLIAHCLYEDHHGEIDNFINWVYDGKVPDILPDA